MNVSRETIKNGQLCELRITGCTSDGEGVGRVDGAVVFVPYAVEGELLRVRIVNVGKSVAHGRIVEILERSPARIEPDCPYFGRCGGCDFRHVTYAEECRLKRQRVFDALSRIGGAEPGELPMHGAPEQNGYRNKVQYPVGQGKNRAVAGFFRNRTHEIISIESCKIQPECADRIRAAVLSWMEKEKLRGYDEKTHTGTVRHIYLRRGWVSGQLLCCIVVNCAELRQKQSLISALLAAEPGLTSIVLSYHQKRGNTVLGERFETVYGADTIEDTLCGNRFRLSPRSFYQINHDQAERLYEKALEFADLHGNETVLDLYCGVGTITLCLAKRAKKAYGVEIIASAIEDARLNARENGIGNAEFFCADASEAAKRFAQAGQKPDVIVADPPRKGLAPEVIEAMLAMQPERIVYVSCDPATLARDVRLLTQSGYRLQNAEAFDLFPRCAHVETVALLERKCPIDHIKVKIDIQPEYITSAEAKATYSMIAF